MFGELSAIQAESATRDLQFWNGPWPSNKQGTRFSNHLYAHFFRKVEKLHCFVTNEVPFRFHEELMVREAANKEIYTFRVVQGLQISKEVDF